jgi:predicted nucleotidyltransferase component of viral defense system
MLHFDAVPSPVRSLLSLLPRRPALAGFALGGGTSLALRCGHRVSVDLDFFTARAFDPEQLALQLDLADAVQVNRAVNTLTLDAGGVKLDFLRHAYPLLAPPEIIEGIPLMALADVVAMKLNALANRGAKKDFYDLCELQNQFPLGAMIRWFEQKYRAADRFTVIRSLVWFEDAESDPDPVSLTGMTWLDVKSAIRASVAALV